MKNIIRILQKEFENGGAQVKEGILMSDYTTFKTGGPAAVGIFPQSEEAATKAVRILAGAKYCVLGNGSNVLFPDKGYDGAVIVTSQMKDVSFDGELVDAQCGASLTKTAALAMKNSLSGLEFAYGIPGSIGGAVYMNAGAYGGEMSHVVVESRYIDSGGNSGVLTQAEHDFSYRHSAYTDTDRIIIGCKMRLSRGNMDEIKAKTDENVFRRRDKQPLEYPSAGSVFKRPTGYFAGKLISDCGLKGYTVGGAQVSQKHAGFIINIGGATSDDILRLIEHIKGEVARQFGVELECEVRYIC